MVSAMKYIASLFKGCKDKKFIAVKQVAPSSMSFIERRYVYIKTKKLVTYGLRGWVFVYHRKAVSIVIQNDWHFSYKPMKNQELEQITKEEFEDNECM